MERDFRRIGGTLALRGLLGILFGLAIVIWPGAGAVALVALFAIFALVDGIVALAASFRLPRDGRLWAAVALEGVVGVAAGLCALFWPGITARALLFLAGIWAVGVGVLEIFGAMRFRRFVAHDWLYVVGGIVTVLFGLLILARPALGGLALLYAIGFMVLAHGVALVGTGFHVRELATDLGRVQHLG